MIKSDKRPGRGILLAGLAVGFAALAAVALAKRQPSPSPIKCQCIKAPCDCGGVPDGEKKI